MTKHDENIMFSSQSDEWETPQDLFDVLNAKYSFKLDPCATYENTKAPMCFTIKDNGLIQDWREGPVFVNPPYSNVKGWVKKAYEECLKGCNIVMLVPARTDTAWFHDYVYHKDKVRYEFIRGRLKFSGSKNSAPFPSMLIFFNL